MIWPFNQSKDPELLLKDLENADPIIREKAFKDLKAGNDPQINRLILAALESSDQLSPEVLLPLIEIAGTHQIEEALPILGDFTRSDDIQIKESAIQALAAIPTQASLDLLVPLLAAEDPPVKQMVYLLISEVFGKDAMGALLRAVPADKTSPLYFEIVALMEDLDLFSRLKENFQHPDYRVKDFNFDNLAKFHRRDFIPLYLEFYYLAAKPRRDQIIRLLEDFSPVELIPYFHDIFKKTLNDAIYQLAEMLIFDKFSTAKQEILEFAMTIRDNRFRSRCIVALSKQFDPYIFLPAYNLLFDQVSEIRNNVNSSLHAIVKSTWLRMKNPEEPNRQSLSKLYEEWEKKVVNDLKNRELGEDHRKVTRRIFYAFAQNRHAVIKPFLREFFENNFHETYFVIKEWPFQEQFNLLVDLVKADPSFASLLLTVAQGNPDEGLWRILLKLVPFLDSDDKTAFRRNLLNRNRSISLEPFIKDSDAIVRATAIEFAAELKINGLIELLKKATKDPAPEVRLKALECLSGNNYPQAQASLIEALSDPDEEVAFFSIVNLKDLLGSGKFAPYLSRFINSPVERIREFALRELAEISKKRYLSNFHNLNPEVRKLAAKVIQKIDQNFSDQIVHDLSSLDPQVRLQAARLLENIQIDAKGKEALLAAMKDPSKLVRAAVVKTLGVMGDTNLIKHLISFFNDPDPRVRANTIEAISSLGDRQAIQILLPFLEDSNNRIRANAVVGISKIGQVNVVPVLQKMIQGRNANMQASAIWAIGEIGDENFLNFIYPFLNHRDEMLRFNAIRSISRIKPEVLQPYLPNLRKDPSTKIRKLVTGISFKVL